MSTEQVAEAESLGAETYERWSAHRGHYPNTKASHRRGKLGEIAVESWALKQGWAIEPWFRDPNRQEDADLQVEGLRIEVKSWNSTGWQAWGRCIRPGQVQALTSKADAILWCYIQEGPAVTVTIAGWSTVDEVAAKPTTTTGPAHNRLENHQLDEAELRSLGSLVSDDR